MRNTLLNQPTVSAQDGSSSAAMAQRCLSTASNGHPMPMETKKVTNALLPSVQEMFPPAKPGYKPLRRETTLKDCRELFQSLKNYGNFTGLYWLMSPEPQIQATPLPVATIDEIFFFSEEFPNYKAPKLSVNICWKEQHWIGKPSNMSATLLLDSVTILPGK